MSRALLSYQIPFQRIDPVPIRTGNLNKKLEYIDFNCSGIIFQTRMHKVINAHYYIYILILVFFKGRIAVDTM